MRAALILPLAIAALSAAPAAAWQELPFRTLPGGNVASCLRATGTEGGLAAIGPLGLRSTPTDLLATGPARPAVRARVPFGIARACAVVREQGGAGVAAAFVVPLGKRNAEIHAAVRDASGSFGVPVPLGRARGAYDAAVSGHGHALVVWVQQTGSETSRRARVVFSRRAPGAPFGPSEALTPWRRVAAFSTTQAAAAFDRDGRATVAWALRSPASRTDDDLVSVEVATAPPAGAFGPAQTLTRRAREVERLALAVAAGGAALLAHDVDEHVRLFERAPGAPPGSALPGSSATPAS